MANYKPEILVNGVWLSSNLVYAEEAKALAFAFKCMTEFPDITDYRAATTYLPVTCTDTEETSDPT